MAVVIRRIALLVCVALVSTSCALVGLSDDCAGTELIGKFEQVGDLVRNANVQSADVVIGSVKAVELDHDDWVAQVTMCIQPEEKIARDVEATVRTTSLLGEKFIDLKPLSTGAPYLEDGDVIPLSRTGKATELEDVFARLAAVLGAGNLEQINRFTSAQARILRNNGEDLKEVLERLRQFAAALADRKTQIAGGIDELDTVSRTLVAESGTLESFLESFEQSSRVLADNKRGLQELLFALDRFTSISVQLLNQTEAGLNKQFDKLRPVLRTLVNNSRNVSEFLQTMATFSQWFPESMPGDYLQLDVCQAGFHDYKQGVHCPQAIGNDREGTSSPSGSSPSGAGGAPSSGLELILQRPLEEGP